jgi:hypothetical protein
MMCRMRFLSAMLQPYAELFGLRCGIPTPFILNFSEEVVRDQALFVGSLLAAELEPRLRTAAGASSWQVRSAPMLHYVLLLRLNLGDSLQRTWSGTRRCLLAACLLQSREPRLRTAADASSWQVRSAPV